MRTVKHGKGLGLDLETSSIFTHFFRKLDKVEKDFNLKTRTAKQDDFKSRDIWMLE